ncbi:uncharacterized protein LOC133736598 isoform X2 [Rosa rugosa]|uniref:uncharacterized protein LOC133736598 isoform X2 n=1 Tax=Rosa rugosa TaxID=74645 RepID=UPI002B4019F3|nr:uncharacterized protein LOC133736598 isoform X2 [Rosa rugosa]
MFSRGGIISHSFELEAKTKGLFSGATAVITFRFPSKAALQRIQLGKARCLFDQNVEGPVTYTIVILSMRILHLLTIQSTCLHWVKQYSRDCKVEIRMGSG